MKSLTKDQLKLAIKDAIDTYNQELCTPETFVNRICQIRFCKNYNQVRDADWFDMTEEYKKQNCINYKISWWDRITSYLILHLVILRRN